MNMLKTNLQLQTIPFQWEGIQEYSGFGEVGAHGIRQYDYAIFNMI